MPANFCSMLIRAQGGSVPLPMLVGTAIQCPFTLPRYSLTFATGPYCAISDCTTSSSGSSFSDHWCTVH